MHTRKFSTSDFFIIAFLSLLAIISAFPFYNVFILSFGNAAEIAKHQIYLIPSSFDLRTYEFIFENGKMVNAMFVTIFITVVGTAFSMLLTISAGYALTKKTLPGQKFSMLFIIFTMFFSGGLIPYYLTIKNIYLVNSILVMIIPMAMNAFYLMVIIAFFRAIPPELEESAKIDGANDIHILFRIIVQVSMPTIATLSLFYAVDRWNEWWHGMLFIKDMNKYPLQLMLRELLMNYQQMMQGDIGASMALSKAQVYPENLKMAIIMVASLPILMVYPFLQKYFAKGIMIGAIKG
ncbi:carbohydrate ABC transporter permease [Paenibacillus sp. FSL R10-2734]|uniref:carbohydrate ABC transporter permease n=1 Tax=Paenibacillus sp. FSL R10-2734 TaxID=2954691 RepID=UPI0030DDBE70